MSLDMFSKSPKPSSFGLIGPPPVVPGEIQTKPKKKKKYRPPFQQIMASDQLGVGGRLGEG